MSLILPYEEKLSGSDGAYISPEGKFIYPSKGHERYAQEYCNGRYYSELNKIRSDALAGIQDGSVFSDEYFEHMIRKFGYVGERKDIDPFLSSKLTKEKLKLYKLWLKEYMFTKNNLYADFMIYVLGFDKVETVMRQCITTSSRAPHVRFFNYYLMGWTILVKSPEIYSEEAGCFISDNTMNPYAVEEGAAIIELNELKANVLKKDLIYFLK